MSHAFLPAIAYLLLLQSGQEPPKFEERLLSRKPPGEHWMAPIVSSDLKRVVWATSWGREEKKRVVIDGAAGEEFDWISMPRFLPDGRVFYAARNHDPGTPSYRPTGTSFIVLDGRAAKVEYMIHSEPVLSEDGAKITYVTEYGERKMAVVVDGKPGETYAWVKDPVISPDGRVGYVAHTKVNECGNSPPLQAAHAVVDGVKGPAFHWVEQLVFSPDGKSHAYVARMGPAFFVMNGDKKGPEFRKIEHLRFHPDGKRVVYVAEEAEWKQRLVVGDDQGAVFTGVGKPVISPDGKVVTYQGYEYDPARPGMMPRNLYVVNGVKSGPYWATSDPVIMPDGRTVACLVKSEKGYAIVRGDQLGPTVEGLTHVQFGEGGGYPVLLAFSPDGKNWSARVNSSSQRHTLSVIVNDRAHLDVYAWQAPVFSPDGRKAGFLAYSWKTQEVRWRVVPVD